MLFLYSLAWTLIIYGICRLQFLLWNWNYFKSQSLIDILSAFVLGIRFDLSAVAILGLVPFVIYALIRYFLAEKKQLKKQLFLWLFLPLILLFQIPILILNLNDAEFIHFLGRRYTFDALFFLAEVPGKFFDLFWSYRFLNLFSFVILSTFVIGLVKLIQRYSEESVPRKKQITVSLVTFIFMFIAARGGLQNKPINFAHAQVFAQPMMNSLVMNTPFTLIQTVKRASLPRDQFYSQEEMLKWVTLNRDVNTPKLKTPLNLKPNIVLIILESMSYEFLGSSGSATGYTPFLDSLSQQSISFKNAYANARRSIEGIGAIMGGIPSLMAEPFLSSQYLTNHFIGLGSELSSLGYHTSFFHGAKNGSMYFDQFMLSAGVKNYFGKNEYANLADDDGTWGIWDEPFLQWAEQKMDEFPQPFFVSFFSLSSHHPFRVPEKYQNQFPKGESEIHEVVGYTDFALKQFFDKAKQSPWYDNTIFVITADHTYKPVKPEFENELGNYRIPLIIFSPKIILPPVDQEQLVQHIDIMPTILDLVGYKPQESNLMGNSIFNRGKRFVVNQTDGNYIFLQDKYWLSYLRGGEFKLYSIDDKQRKLEITDKPEQKKEMTERLKALMQYFSQGMWDNKLYFPAGK